MAKIRRYFYDTKGIISCEIYDNTRVVAVFYFYVPDKLGINPSYRFLNFFMPTLGELNYEVFLFIKRVSKLLASGSMKEYKSSNTEVEIDIPSDDALF